LSDNQPYKITTLTGRLDLLSLCGDKSSDYPFYIESSSLNTDNAAHNTDFDILFAFPQEYLIKDVEQHVSIDGEILENTCFLTELDRVYKKNRIDTKHNLPFCGGWFVYLGYELVNEIEPKLEIKKFENSLPVAFAARIPAAIIYSHKKNKTYVVVEQEFLKYQDRILADLDQINEKSDTQPAILKKVKESPDDDYKNAINKILDYIKEGDVFQVNLSRLWQAKLNSNVSSIDIFKRLRRFNPAPFSALINYGDYSIISSSPERLVSVTQSKVETRPIAGTRPRNKDIFLDRQLRNELLENIKERAEHIMLIDLERNDLGRICTYGSIEVDELMVLESYSHVHHIVSNIVGILKDDVLPGQIIKAVFPGGTITGCPKVRCMEIISELEKTPRGSYTGSLGYLDRNGNMDLNILIRTFTKHADDIHFRAGAGIVADSSPEKELEETRSKAKGLLMALEG